MSWMARITMTDSDESWKLEAEYSGFEEEPSTSELDDMTTNIENVFEKFFHENADVTKTVVTVTPETAEDRQRRMAESE
jgi:hypothetical protein